MWFFFPSTYNPTSCENQNLKRRSLHSLINADNVMPSSSDEEFSQDNSSNLSDNQSLHRAAEILQKAISGHKKTRKAFPSVNEISKEKFESQVPDVLLTFSKWLLKTSDDNKDTDFLALSNVIMSFCFKQFSKNNLQIGLGLYIYNNIRSKKKN